MTDVFSSLVIDQWYECIKELFLNLANKLPEMKLIRPIHTANKRNANTEGKNTREKSREAIKPKMKRNCCRTSVGKTKEAEGRRSG